MTGEQVEGIKLKRANRVGKKMVEIMKEKIKFKK